MKHVIAATRLISFGLLIAFFCNPAHADESLTKIWQGEWGHYDALKNTELQNYLHYYGGNISVHDCEPTQNTCKVDVITDNPPYDCSFSGKLALISTTQAKTQLTGYGGEKKDCLLNLDLLGDASSPVIHVTRQGKECNDFCTASTGFVETFPFIEKANINRVWDPQCYINPSKALHAWCASEEIQKLDEDNMGKLWDHADALKSNSPDHPHSDENIKNWRKEIWQECDKSSDPVTCLKNLLNAKIAELQSDIQKVTALYQDPGDTAQAKALITTMAGVYKNQTTAMDMDKEIAVEDIFEFVPISDDAAYINVHINFTRSECNIAGLVEYKKIGAFVYQDEDTPESPEDSKCQLTIGLQDKTIKFSDPTFSCRAACGDNASFNGDFFDLSQKRKIRYMPKILKSEEYQDALRQYKASHPDSK